MQFQTAEFISSSTYMVHIRYPWSQTIAVNDRIAYQDVNGLQTFIIDAVVDPEFRHRELQILAHIVNEVA
jgi:head-tail adaptor